MNPSTNSPLIISTQSQQSHLTNLDLSVLRTYAARSLTDQLDAILGPKTIIIDPSLAGPLGLVTEVSNLKEHGVDKLFWLEPGPLGNAGSLKNVVWVCKPTIKAMKVIAGQFSIFCDFYSIPSTRIIEKTDCFAMIPQFMFEKT